MYNCLLVDDELLLSEALKSKILRLKAIHNLPIHEVLISSSVDQAVTVIQEHNIDIVITDMKMPEKNGIHLIEELNRMKHHAKIIVISGYDDYQYVRNAFNLGAVDYLLKPVQLDNLLEKMNQVIALIDEGQNQAKSHINQELMVFTYSLEKQLNRYLTKDIPFAKLYEIHTMLPNPLFGVVLFSCNSDDPAAPMLDEFYSKERDKLTFNCVMIKNPDGYSMLVLNCERKNQEAEILSYLNNACRFVQENQLHLHCAISSFFTDISDFKKIYEQTKKNLSRYLIVPISVAKSECENSDKTSALPKSTVDQIDFLFKKQDFSEIRNYMNHIYVDVDVAQTPIEYLEQIYDLFFYRFGVLAEEYQFKWDFIEKKPFYSFHSRHEIALTLRNATNQLQQMYTEHIGREKSITGIVKRYIEENYHHAINMAEIANMVSVSYNYFSKLFKQETGKSFSEYLTDVRMLNAQKLMENPTLRIKEISEMTGYESAYSFSRAFTQYYGMSAREWRAKKSAK